MDKKAKQLLEQKIEQIVRKVLREYEDKSTLGQDTVSSDESFKRKYREVQDMLTRPEFDATQIMAKALNFSPSDDTARSHAFKKLHKEKTPDGNSTYEFSSEELGKIKNILQAV